MRSALIAVVSLCLTANPLALPATELDELLSGFETEENGEEAKELDDLLGGFDDTDDSEDEAAIKAKKALPNWLELQGSLALRSAFNSNHDAPQPGEPDYRGLAMLRTMGELVADFSYNGWKMRVGGTAFYDGASQLNDQRDLYTDEYLDEYESEIELGEAYLQGSLADNLDLRIGRQIVVWGKSDNLRVTDVLNPLDNRWPGMTDIRYLRLPATMTKIDWFSGDWSSSLILVHEPGFAKTPVYNGEFYFRQQAAPELLEPGWSWENQQPALAVNGIFSGWDIAFYLADVFPDSAIMIIDDGKMYRTYEKSLMAGAAVNIAMGNWLVKSETAYWDGLAYSNSRKKSRFDLLAGLEYSGFSETTISFEVVNRHILDYEKDLSELPDGKKEDTTQYAFRFVRDFMNDTLHLTIVLSSYGFMAEDGGFERFQLDYDLNDNIVLTGGVMLYESGDQPFLAGIGDNDKIFFEVKYNF